MQRASLPGLSRLKLPQPKSALPKQLLVLCLVVLLIGTGLRFSNLEKKVFWHDEAYTAVPISGQQRSKIWEEMYNYALNGQTFTPQDFQRYQVPHPNTRLANTIDAVAEEEPQNSPLYFILARLWMEQTNLPPILGLRLLSVLIGLLAFPLMYALGLQLFQSAAIAWVGVALFLTSPLQLLYAQEARQYSLLTVVTLASSTVLLKAIESNRPGYWVLYCLSCIAGLYTQPFFAFVMVAHGVYTVLGEQFRLKRIGLYLVASLVSVLAFNPWLQIILDNLDAISDWRGVNTLPFIGLIGRWLLNLCHIFVDFYIGDRHNYDLYFSLTNPYLYLCFGILALVSFAFVFLIRTTPRKIWLFVVCLTVFPTLILMVPDLLQGGIRSTVPRYALPSVVGIQLAVAYLLGERIFSPQLPIKRQQVWRSLLALVLTLGILSSLQISQAQTWWNKYSNYYDSEIAALINDVPEPALLSRATIRLASISYLLRPDTSMLTTRRNQPILLIGKPDIFIYDLDIYAQEVRDQLQDEYGLESQLVFHRPLGFMDGEIHVWRAEPAS